MRLRLPAAIPGAIIVAVTALLAGLLVASVPARAAAFIDAAGRRVVLPDRIARILPAERNAEVLVFVLAPGRLAGIEARAGRRGGAARSALLGWRPRSTPDSMAATARQVRADVIIDAGTVTPERAAFADAVQGLSGIPYILVDSSIERTPTVLRSIGAIIGVGERAEDLRTYSEHAVAELRGRLLIRPATARPRVYYGLGADGLTVPLPGSPAGAAIAEAGALNVAAALGGGTQLRVSREQLLGWDPDVIIAETRTFYNALRRDRSWRRLSAVRNHKVYLEPSMPFGWLHDPAGVNRVIGLYWLAGLLYPEDASDETRAATWRGVACEFYEKFYRIRLTNARLDAMVQPAGAPRPSVPRSLAQPLVSSGGTPPSTGAAGGTGFPSTTAATRSVPCTVPGGNTPIGGAPGLSPEMPPLGSGGASSGRGAAMPSLPTR